MKFTEGAFRDWGYELATSEFRDVCITEQKAFSTTSKRTPSSACRPTPE